MKKLLLLCYLTMAASVFESFAQVSSFPWTEDFESGIPEGFSFIDSENDTYNWHYSWHRTRETSAQGDMYDWTMCSDGGYDTWMILPSFSFSNSSLRHIEFSWSDNKHNITAGSAQYYSVYISNSGRTISDFTTNGDSVTYHPTLANVWTSRTINLDDYIGQTINIAFRHLPNSSGKTLYIDDLAINVIYEDSNGLYFSSIPMTTVIGCSDSITDLIISNTVTTIQEGAFSNHTNINTVTIPNGVTYIGGGAFSGCTNIITVNYNAENCRQTNGSFQNFTSITTLNIGNTVQYIPDNMFSGCAGISSVIIPNSVTEIGSNTFSNCTGITTLSIGNNVNIIGQQAFYGCAGLTAIMLPNSVVSIGIQAFCGCTGLVELTIPEGVSNIGFNAFGGCSNIATVNFNARNCGQDGGVFQNNTSLATLNIGNEVQYIPNNMFRGCTSLVSLNVPDAVSEIGDAAFYGCSNLTSTSFGNGLASIGNDAFSQCTRLTSVSFGDGIANIGNNAFMNCGIIGELVIPQGVISIGSKGFKDCFGITEITCLGRVAPTLGANAFDGVDTSITVNIPCGTTNLYAGRWSYFHNFNEIPFLFNVASTDLAQGTVEMLQEPTCNDPVAIVQATPRDGYRFDHWSDGSTQNPYTCTAMGSLTLTAYFASTTEGIDDIETDGIRVYVVDGRIIVEGAENETVRVFDLMGLCVGDNCSQRLTTGVYLVKVGSLPARKVVVIK